MVTRAQDAEPGVQKLALESLGNEIRRVVGRRAPRLTSWLASGGRWLRAVVAATGGRASSLCACLLTRLGMPWMQAANAAAAWWGHSTAPLHPVSHPFFLLHGCRTATTSMTSVPKPLKFLRAHYATLKKAFEALPKDHPNRQAFADVLSVGCGGGGGGCRGGGWWSWWRRVGLKGGSRLLLVAASGFVTAAAAGCVDGCFCFCFCCCCCWLRRWLRLLLLAASGLLLVWPAGRCAGRAACGPVETTGGLRQAQVAVAEVWAGSWTHGASRPHGSGRAPPQLQR